MKNNKGFTLMELLVVVIIIVGFAAFAYPSYVSSIERARASEAVNMLATIQAVQSKHFVHYEEYGMVFRDINDFEPAIANFDASQNSFCSDSFCYTLSEEGANPMQATAERVDLNHNSLNRGYELVARYNENAVRCYVLNGSEDGDKVCSSLTDLDRIDEGDGYYYPIR